MARVIVGYEGEGRGRRPIFKDEGPARGRTGDRGGSDDVSRLGAQVLPSRFLTGGDATYSEQDDGPASIERRQLTDMERSARARVDDAPSPIAPRAVAGITKPHLLSRTSGPVTPPDPPELSPRRDPVVAPIRPPLVDYDDGVSTPQNVTPDLAPDPDPFELVTPCGDCSHRVVCSIRPTLKAPEIVEFTLLRTGVRIATVSIECDHFLPADVAPVAPEQVAIDGGRIVSHRRADPVVIEPIPVSRTRRSRGAAGARGGLTPEEFAERDRRAALVIAALERHNGNTKLAGEELGLRGNVVARIAQGARDRAAKAATA